MKKRDITLAIDPPEAPDCYDAEGAYTWQEGWIAGYERARSTFLATDLNDTELTFLKYLTGQFQKGHAQQRASTDKDKWESVEAQASIIKAKIDLVIERIQASKHEENGKS